MTAEKIFFSLVFLSWGIILNVGMLLLKLQVMITFKQIYLFQFYMWLICTLIFAYFATVLQYSERLSILDEETYESGDPACDDVML